VKVATLARGVLDASEPVLRADDEALLRGAAAFETVRVYAGRPFLLAEHLARFRGSIDALALHPADGVEDLVADLAHGDGVMRLYRTTYDVVATFDALPPGLEEERARGLRVGTVAVPPGALDGVKATSYAYAFAARRAAGTDDVVFVADGMVLEATTANVWWRRGDELFTPRTRAGVLPGVTRGFLCGVADVTEGDFPLGDLLSADEAFLTSSIREVMPVIEVDGHEIGDGRPGPAAARLQAALRLGSAR
jgi:4-amino-4-deoxychorismate lyase